MLVTLPHARVLPFLPGAYEDGSPGAGVLLPGHSMEDREDRARLMAEIYAELRQLAERLMRNQPRDHTLQATALVNEACLKLFGRERLESEDRGQLLALAATAMRNILVDHFRGKKRAKRTAPGVREPLEGIALAYEDRAIDTLALHEALERLAAFEPEMARAVELRFFGGLSLAETALLLGLPQRTFERRWAAARAWLAAEIA